MRAGLYRLHRLRRLILVSVIPPVLVLAALMSVKGLAAFALLPIAVGLPILHLVRYPNAWTETLALSLTLACVFGLAGLIGPDVGLLGLAVRLAGLCLAGGLIFMGMTLAVAIAVEWGPMKSPTMQTSARSTLPKDELRRAITLYPGRSDDKTTCGAADEDGIFPITVRCAVPAMDPTVYDLAEDERLTADGLLEVKLHGVVYQSTDSVHDVICIEDGKDESTTLRMEFFEDGEGTRVEMREHGAPMPPGFRFGLWVQDYFADHLIDEIDRAEGRPSRSIRSASQNHLLVDFADWLTGAEDPVHPAE